MNIWKRYSMRVSKNWVKFNKMFTLSPCRNSAVLVEWGKRQSPCQRQLHLGFIVSVQTQVGKVEVAAGSSGSWPFLTLIRLVLFAFGLVVGLGLDKVVALIGT